MLSESRKNKADELSGNTRPVSGDTSHSVDVPCNGKHANDSKKTNGQDGLLSKGAGSLYAPEFIEKTRLLFGRIYRKELTVNDACHIIAAMHDLVDVLNEIVKEEQGGANGNS